MGVFESELVHRPVAGAELRAFAVGAVAQLWGRLRGSDFRLALDSCPPLDKQCINEFTRLGRKGSCCQDIMILVQPCAHPEQLSRKQRCYLIIVAIFLAQAVLAWPLCMDIEQCAVGPAHGEKPSSLSRTIDIHPLDSDL